VVIVGRPLLRLAVLSGSVLLVAGLIFVLARWSYFGFPLPNPYYKKGAGTLHLDGLNDSVAFTKEASAIPILLLILVGVLGSVSRRWIAYIGCTGVLLGMWILVSSEGNYDYRFQFPIVTVVLLMVIDLGSREQPSLARRAATISSEMRSFAPVLVASVLVTHYVATQRGMEAWEPTHLGMPADQVNSSRETIAKVLAGSGHHDLVVATTEAGYICWQSGWRCIDLWGLNDKRITHEGYLGEGELEELNPDVIVIDNPTSPTASSIPTVYPKPGPVMAPPYQNWGEMTDPLIHFAQSRGYVLAALLDPALDYGMAVYVKPGKDWSNQLISEFGAIEPTIESFYGPLLRLKCSHLTTNG
jgi:hypothetical protein